MFGFLFNFRLIHYTGIIERSLSRSRAHKASSPGQSFCRSSPRVADVMGFASQ